MVTLSTKRFALGSCRSKSNSISYSGDTFPKVSLYLILYDLGPGDPPIGNTK